jgi:hypothetical protein
MVILEVFAGAFAATEVAKNAEPQRFLEVAAAIATAAQPSPSVESASILKFPPVAKSKPKLLDQEICNEHVEALRVRGIRLQTSTRVVAARTPEGNVVLFAESGAIYFNGPLPTLPTFRRINWDGIAETIEIAACGDVQFVNNNGVYGSVKEQGSRRVLLTLETPGEMSLRSMDKDPDTGKIRPLAAKYVVAGVVEQKAEPPCEIKIGIDSIYGIRRTEQYASPTSVLIGNKLHRNVMVAHYSPTVGMIRIESVDSQGAAHSYCVNPNS